ncbi:MAG TPA: hypothetical protein VGC91_11955 [Pyrinomonadaceae bacterium]
MNNLQPLANKPQIAIAHESASPFASSDWLRNFVIFEFACQLALLFDLFGNYRVMVRAAAFGISLLYLIVLPRGRGKTHPATQSAFWAMAILALSFFHPNTNSLLASTAQILLYLAILGPLFWVPRLHLDMKALRQILLVIFIFHTLSAATGVLQAQFPGSFQPNLSAVIAGKDPGYVEDLKITLANGQRVFRPMGLTDVPGGAASAGFYTVLLGMGFYMTHQKRAARWASLGSIALGLTCLYLAQVRLWVVITAICVLAFGGFLIWQKRTARLIGLGSILAVLIVLSFTYAVAIGGKSVSNRMSSFVQASPDTVYYKNRGVFLEDTVKVLLPQYPLGAGLGRWGMMNFYFGDNTDPQRDAIYVEIQWTGWLIDGGVPLIAAYVIALMMALLIAFKIALNRGVGDLSTWGAIVLAYGMGALAMTFSYPVFIGQAGMEFWLINALLFAAARTMIPRLNKIKASRR